MSPPACVEGYTGSQTLKAAVKENIGNAAIDDHRQHSNELQNKGILIGQENICDIFQLASTFYFLFQNMKTHLQ